MDDQTANHSPGPSGLAGLYVHLPFCASKCRYCDFYSTTDLLLIPDFLEALAREMALNQDDSRLFDTIYLGGGTPSVLSIPELAGLWRGIKKYFPMAKESEITIEVNPGDGDLSYFQELKRLGFNRINLGAQSFNDRTLSFLRRRHSAHEARTAAEIAARAGFDRIGLDLIYGSPGEDISAWRETLDIALRLPATHLSCYQLTPAEDTPLKKMLDKGLFALPEEQAALDLFLTTAEILGEAGFDHYEVSNFARGDIYRSRHNQKYWRHVPYLGLGPSAHSFDGERRLWNTSSLNGYLGCVKNGERPPGGSEVLSRQERELETIYLGLRTKDGIDLKSFRRRFQRDLLAGKEEVAARLEREGLVMITGDSLRPTGKGLALADSLALLF